MRKSRRDGLLPRMEAIVRKKGISYRYHPVGGKPVSLGMDKTEAVRKVLNMLGAAGDLGTIGRLWEQFQETSQWKRYAEHGRLMRESAGRVESARYF